MRRPLLKPRKLEKLSWDVYEKQGEIMGRARGKELAARAIVALERRWGGPPKTPQQMALGCQRMEEIALTKAFIAEESPEEPVWSSGKLAACRYPWQSREWQVLDMRIWRAYQHALVTALREKLAKYGCTNLRFLDAGAFLRYYRGEEN